MNRSGNTNLNAKAFCVLILAGPLSACAGEPGRQLETAESFIDAFYSFQLSELEPFLENAPSSAPAIIYYQGWAEGGHYKIIDRKACEQPAPDMAECSITVEDDPILALGLDFKVTDTFHISFKDGAIVAVTTSSDDPQLYHDAADWVRSNLPDLIELPCAGFFDGGPTPGECAKAMAQGYAIYAASDDFPNQ